MNIRKQRTFSLLFLLLMLTIFLLPVFFAALLLQNMRKLCTVAFESEAAVIAEKIAGLNTKQIREWYQYNKRPGSIYVWTEDAGIPVRYGDDNDIWLLAARPTQEKTEIRGSSFRKQRIVSKKIAGWNHADFMQK